MDCGSTGTAAGIDPKILDNWQTDAAFSIASWEHPAYKQALDWDTSQDSSQGDGEIVGMNPQYGTLPKDQPDTSYSGQLNGYCRGDNRCGPDPSSFP